MKRRVLLLHHRLIDRRAFLAITVGLLGAVSPVDAQPARVWRIGVLGNAPSTHLDAAFREGLRDLGWVEGRNIHLVYRYSDGRNERLPELATELIRLNVDVLVAWAAPEADAAKHATNTIPIVFLVHGDPIGTGHVASLARPGGNMTGSTQMLSELSVKQLELLRRAFPSVARVGVLWNAAVSAKQRDWNEAQSASRALSIALQSFEVRERGDFDVAFAAIKRERPDALLTFVDPLTYSYRALIVDFAREQRVPAIYPLREYVDAGGLMAYGVDLRDLFRRGATYVDRILKGAKPADLPVQQATKFELIINLKTAKALGLTIPPSLLLRADQVIE